MFRSTGIAVLLVSLMAVVSAASPASAWGGADDEARIKAGIVLNLALAVSWPETTLASGTIVIGVLGQDDSDPRLDPLDGLEVRHRKLVLRDPLPPSLATESQILYISRSQQANLPRLLAELAGRPVLTVSELDGFCEAGGMVQLQRDRNRITLRINRRAAEQSGLRLGSQLLKLAEIVEGGD